MNYPQSFETIGFRVRTIMESDMNRFILRRKNEAGLIKRRCRQRMPNAVYIMFLTPLMTIQFQLLAKRLLVLNVSYVIVVPKWSTGSRKI